jgi:hypothetical protein
MSTPIRLDDQLVRDAETEAASHKRTPPKQIEYWAEIGKTVSRFASSNDLLALIQGVAEVTITPPPSKPIEPSDVFNKLDQDRKQGTLSHKVTQQQFDMKRVKANQDC